ncbi:MBL fold metallo-hydrolase [Paenibacillus filicis]|uniref:MBL fold metallo-hydrolase n=1 Tax=Paenibacillus filicis TaxID=669464 RepID=A0ABU9DJS1_9BACL
MARQRFGADFIQEINNTRVPYGMLAIWFLGQESVVVKGGDTTVYIDPYLSENSNRMFAAPIQPEHITNATYCLITHDHLDHLDLATVSVMGRNNAGILFMAPGYCHAEMLNRGISQEQLLLARTGEWWRGSDIQIKAVPAAHEEFEYDAELGHRYVGYILKLNGVTLYHAGDTLIYPGLVASLKEEAIDIGMLPINGRDAFRSLRLIGNMNYREAVELAVAADMDTVVPLHYDLLKGNTEKPGYFIDYLHEYYPEQKSHVLARYEKYIYVSKEFP